MVDEPVVNDFQRFYRALGRAGQSIRIFFALIAQEDATFPRPAASQL
jgi:hypothetical protein